MSTPADQRDPGPELADSRPFRARYGDGGVPWYLLLKYLGFLTFFTWYCLEYQLPDYLEQGPGRQNQAPEHRDETPPTTQPPSAPPPK